MLAHEVQPRPSQGSKKEQKFLKDFLETLGPPTPSDQGSLCLFNLTLMHANSLDRREEDTAQGDGTERGVGEGVEDSSLEPGACCSSRLDIVAKHMGQELPAWWSDRQQGQRQVGNQCHYDRWFSNSKSVPQGCLPSSRTGRIAL